VYDVELDKVFRHEFGPASYPVQHCWDADDFKLLSVESNKYDGSAEEEFNEDESNNPNGPMGGHEVIQHNTTPYLYSMI
jgi:hypothetical protein